MKLPTTVPILTALLAAPAISFAGELTSPTPLSEPESGSGVSGSLSLDVNTHFVSYGADIWGAGNSFSDPLFNPSLELSFALSDDVTLILGTWWDVNDNADSSIGNSIQEVDVWAGISFDMGKVNTTILYQEWLYANESERIVDLIFALDAPLSPSLTIHGRVDEGASGGDTGVVAVLGLEHGFEMGPVSFSLPVSVAAATDGFHGGGSGFAYASAGVGASMPLSFISENLGDWSLNSGLTYYYTDDSVIPGNADDSFLTGSIGVSIDF